MTRRWDNSTKSYLICTPTTGQPPSTALCYNPSDLSRRASHYQFLFTREHGGGVSQIMQPSTLRSSGRSLKGAFSFVSHARFPTRSRILSPKNKKKRYQRRGTAHTVARKGTRTGTTTSIRSRGTRCRASTEGRACTANIYVERSTPPRAPGQLSCQGLSTLLNSCFSTLTRAVPIAFIWYPQL